MPTLPHVEDTFASIDAEIARLHELIRQLHTRRNALSPINRLPCELIRKIMLQLKDDSTAGRRVTYHFVKVAQICGHWREIALGYSSLWTILAIPPAGVWWLAELCRRSGSAPISRVDVQGWWHPAHCPLTQGFADLLRDQLHRIQELYFNIDEEVGRALLPRVQAPAPSLERLSILAHRDRLVLPPNFCDGSLPKLQFLHLRSCSFSWDHSLFTATLRNLRIEYPGYRPQSIPFFRLLSSLSNLNNLELRDALPNVPPEPIDNPIIGHGPIQLSSLHTLSLSEQYCHYTIHFLTQIRFHHNLCLKLDAGFLNVNEFLDHVTYPILTMEPATSHFNSGFSLHLEEASNELYFTFVNPRNNTAWLDITLNCSRPTDFERKFNACCAIVERLPLENLQGVTLAGDVTIQATTFRKLSRCPNIRELTFKLSIVEKGVNVFIGSLVDGIPQCDIHRQEGPCRGDFTNEVESEEGVTEEEETEYESDGGTEEVDESTDEDQDGQAAGQGLVESVAINHGGTNATNAHDASDGQEAIGPDSISDDYWPLRDDVKPCNKCESLGKSFFPALRKLVLKCVELRRWWTISRNEKRLHPIAELIIRRIRCGLAIEEITFDPSFSQDGWPEHSIADMFRELCGEFGPSIKVILPVKNVELY